MSNVFYECHETGVIKEIEGYEIAQFVTVKKYDVLYSEELPRFKKSPLEIYALPYDKQPSKSYYGMGRMGLDLCDKTCWHLTKEQKKLQKCFFENYESADELMKTEESAMQFVSLFKESKDFELIWARTSGSRADVPNGYELIGFDITYPFEYSGAFSIICDCMFICRWHGCDEEGTLFLPEFNKLNDYGLFNDHQSAYDYMVKYLNEDWAEHGIYCIAEIYKKTEF